MSPTFRAAASMLLTWCRAYRMIETETTAEVERTRVGRVRSGTDVTPVSTVAAGPSWTCFLVATCGG
jgi:hypothetical protein